jgi:hypothetical protein
LFPFSPPFSSIIDQADQRDNATRKHNQQCQTRSNGNKVHDDDVACVLCHCAVDYVDHSAFFLPDFQKKINHNLHQQEQQQGDNGNDDYYISDEYHWREPNHLLPVELRRDEHGNRLHCKRKNLEDIQCKIYSSTIIT